MKPLTIRERQPCWSTMNTHKSREMLSVHLWSCFFFFVLFLFSSPHYVCWSHDVIYDVYMDMHDHIYHVDWLIKDILRLFCSVLLWLCLTTCLFQLVRWSVRVFIERTHEFADHLCKFITTRFRLAWLWSKRKSFKSFY